MEFGIKPSYYYESNFFMMLESISSRSTKMLAAIGWGLLIVCFAFLLTYVLPRKGFDFGDDGFYLSLAQTFRLDHTVEWQGQFMPFFLINSCFMSLGCNNFLCFRWIYYLALLVSLCLLYSGLCAKTPAGFLIPWCVLLGLLTQLNSIFGHQNTSLIFLMAACGLFLLVRRHVLSQKHHVGVLIMTGILLAISGLSNLIMLPTGGLTCLSFACLTGKANKRMALWVTYLLITGCFGIYWVHLCGWEMFSGFARYSNIHSLSFARIYDRLHLIVQHMGPWLALPVLPALLSAVFIRISKVRGWSISWSSFLIVFYVHVVVFLSFVSLYLLLIRLGITEPSYNFKYLIQKLPGQSGHPWFSLLQQTESEILGTSAFIILFAGLAVAFVTLTDTAKRVLLLSFLFLFSFMNQSAFSGCAPMVYSCLYAGPFFGFCFLILADSILLAKSGIIFRNITRVLIMAIWLSFFIIGLSYTLLYNHPDCSIRVWHSTEPIQLDRLRGLRDSPSKVFTLNELSRVYRRYEGETKDVIAFATMPGLYYLLGKPPATKHSYVQPFYMPWLPEQILAYLQKSTNWMVFCCRNFEPEPGWTLMQPVMKYLQDNSSIMITLPIMDAPNPGADTSFILQQVDAKIDRFLDVKNRNLLPHAHARFVVFVGPKEKQPPVAIKETP